MLSEVEFSKSRPLTCSHLITFASISKVYYWAYKDYSTDIKIRPCKVLIPNPTPKILSPC